MFFLFDRYLAITSDERRGEERREIVGET